MVGLHSIVHKLGCMAHLLYVDILNSPRQYVYLGDGDLAIFLAKNLILSRVLHVRPHLLQNLS